MGKTFTILLVVALLATLVTLIMGIFNLVSTKEGHARRSNALMRWRVFFQVIAVGCLTILLLLKNG